MGVAAHVGTSMRHLASVARAIARRTADFGVGTLRGYVPRNMRMLILVLCGALCACTETYHPEYHPVSVTTIHQSSNGPAGGTPLVVSEPVLADPELVFRSR